MNEPNFLGQRCHCGHKNEDKAIQAMKGIGDVVERQVLLVHPLLQLLEVKCPPRSSTSLAELLSQPQSDNKFLKDRQFSFLPDK